MIKQCKLVLIDTHFNHVLSRKLSYPNVIKLRRLCKQCKVELATLYEIESVWVYEMR